MDFVTGLPPFHGFTTIFVVVDRFSRGTHLGALPPKYSAHKVIGLFIDIVCKLHGFPRSLVSDIDLLFLIDSWLNVPMVPIVGDGQVRDCFWLRVIENYNNFHDNL